MALVAVQRSPSVTGSPQCSNSDSEADDDEGSKNEKSECFFAGKGTALVLALKDIPQYAERRLSTDSTRSTNSTQSNSSDIQQHLQSMFNLLRHEETLKMAVKLESQRSNRTRYLVIASRCCYRPAITERRSKISRHNSARMSSSTTGTRHPLFENVRPLSQQLLSQHDSQTETIESVVELAEKRLSMSAYSNRQNAKCNMGDKVSASGDSRNSCNAFTANTISTSVNESMEESCLLGIDCNEITTIGLVVPILADTTIHLDGDGGFSVSVFGKTHIFKPVSVQAMWSALQTLHKVSQKARENNFYPGGPSHDWLSYYESRIESDQSCLNEWNAMDSLESRRPPSPDAIRNKPTAKEETESVIKMKLKEIMMSVDLDEVTSKYIRGRLEEHLDMDLGEYKSFIDEEMLIILGQMDAPTKIFEHVYLGSEWNASNLEELQKNGVRHILNVTREIDNFFPGMFDYFNVRVYDDEKTNLLKHWDNTYRYITRAKAEGSKVLVHCKMGVSRSASVVIAYAMKAYNWEFEQALQHVKERRSCIKPNKNFLNQLEMYRGMLDAMKNKEKLQRSKSETNLKSTKDARLLPGSEPTPLIQALNQSKSKSSGYESMVNPNTSVDMADRGNGRASMRSISSGSDNKQRRIKRRSSSTSPRSIQSQTAAAIVIKQQSQSLENLTPDRSTADEPKNVRFPGSNGENYSVTQNQVLHIQKHTPPPQLQPQPQPQTAVSVAITTPTSPPTATSVRTIVNDLESYQQQDIRKTVDDRKSLNLQFGQTAEDEEKVAASLPQVSANGRNLESPVWTSSAKLITQTSHLTAATGSVQLEDINFAKEESSSRRQHSRKTQSWAATSGGITMDATTSCKNSIESVSTHATTLTTRVFESTVRTRQRHRELPSRHASWGSGDSRYGVPMRNSSWGAYDSNRNSYQYNSNNANANAIFEGQIHELNTNNKTASVSATCTAFSASTTFDGDFKHHQHMGTVKRTKQKLEECKALKKLCHENGEGSDGTGEDYDSIPKPQKRNPNLFRSASAVGSSRPRYAQRCNSEEIAPGSVAGPQHRTTTTTMRRSDGSKPLHAELFPASTSESFLISDIENKNTIAAEIEDSEDVVLRTTHHTPSPSIEDQRISGNVQILKKSFEAKAGGSTTSAATIISNVVGTSVKKGHQSLPSSPIAQHVDHHQASSTTSLSVATTITTATAVGPPFEVVLAVATPAAATPSVSSSSTSTLSTSSSSLSEVCDRNVKGLVHKYQNSNTASSVVPIQTSTVANAMPATFISFKPRPRSYYEQPLTQRALLGRPHEYSESRPPPAPVKTLSSSSAIVPEGVLVQHQQHQQHQQAPQQRRLQQHGKTHPLARLSLPKQSFNAAAYNTM